MWRALPLPLLSLACGCLNVSEALTQVRLVCRTWATVRPAWTHLALHTPVIVREPELNTRRLLAAALPGCIREIVFWRIDIAYTLAPELASLPCLELIAFDMDSCGVIIDELSDLVKVGRDYPELCERVEFGLCISTMVPHLTEEIKALPAVVRLRQFQLNQYFYGFSDSMLAGLVHRDFATLQVLKLRSGWPQVTDIGLESLCLCRGLTTLHLDGQRHLTLVSAAVIGQLIGLVDLRLSDTELTSDLALAHFRDLTRLKVLHLGQASCSVRGLACLQTQDLEELEV